MKMITVALAALVALSSTLALAQTSQAERPRGKAAKVKLQPNYGNPNGNPNGPTTLSGTGNSQFGGSVAGTSGRN